MLETSLGSSCCSGISNAIPTEQQAGPPTKNLSEVKQVAQKIIKTIWVYNHVVEITE